MNRSLAPLYRRRIVLASLAGTAFALARRRVYAQVGGLNDAINKAGRQRMLSQRMAKAWLAIGLDVDTTRARRILGDSMVLFDRQCAELKAYAPTAEIHDTYLALESVWGEYRQSLVGVAPGRQVIPQLIALDGRVLQLAHQGTVQLEKHSGKSVGRLVNVAGRQRMLSQRMAKFYLVQSWKIDMPEAGKELGKAHDEFVQGLRTLHSAAEATSTIQQQLELAQQQWVFFENALQHGAEGDHNSNAQHASQVFSSSENILQVMDRVTGLYASLPAA